MKQRYQRRAPAVAHSAELDVIDALSRGGRNAWLSLLFTLVFVTVTLLGVQDVDFFIPERETALPLVGVTIPTILFFTLSPALIMALYANLHFHLYKLWEAAGRAPAKIDGQPLSDHLNASFITDLALSARKDGPLRQRPLQSLSRSLVFTLVYLAAPIVIFTFWIRSMPAHKEVLTIFWCGVPMLTAFLIGAVSFDYHRNQSKADTIKSKLSIKGIAALIFFSCFTGFLGWITTASTEGTFIYDLPVIGGDAAAFPTSIYGAALVQTPPGWLDYDSAQRAHAREWCKDNDLPTRLCDDRYASGDAFFLQAQQTMWCQGNLDLTQNPNKTCSDFFERVSNNLETDWGRARQVQINSLPSLDLQDVDLRRAIAFNVQLTGANMSRANLNDSNFWNSDLQGADLYRADMRSINLNNANLRGANLINADLRRANLSAANLSGAIVFRTDMSGANLSGIKVDSFAGWHSVQLIGAGISHVDERTMNGLRPYWDDIFANGLDAVPLDDPDRPAHWPVTNMEWDEFEPAWRAWQATLPTN